MIRRKSRSSRSRNSFGSTGNSYKRCRSRRRWIWTAAYKGLQWVGEITEANMGIWVHDADRKAVQRGNREDLLQAAQSQIFMGDFLPLCAHIFFGDSQPVFIFKFATPFAAFLSSSSFLGCRSSSILQNREIYCLSSESS